MNLKKIKKFFNPINSMDNKLFIIACLLFMTFNLIISVQSAYYNFYDKALYEIVFAFFLLKLSEIE